MKDTVQLQLLVHQVHVALLLLPLEQIKLLLR
jgi:hypothetical protein